VENLVIEPREHFPVLNHNVQWIYYVNISMQPGPKYFPISKKKTEVQVFLLGKLKILFAVH